MPTLEKAELIRDFVLENKERFVLANDIRDHFDHIIDYMLEYVLKNITDDLNKSRDLPLEFIRHGRMAGYYYYDLKVNKDFYLRIESYYYFKTCSILICVAGNGFDEKDMQHAALRNKIKTELKNVPVQDSEKWIIARLRFDAFESNYQTNFDLFNVFRDKKLLERLGSAFNDKYGETVKQVTEIILAS